MSAWNSATQEIVGGGVVMAQSSLFDAPATRGASRRSDPRTSVDAGRSLEGQPLRTQQADVLRAVATLARWGRDCTAYEVWQHMESTFTRRPDGSVVGTVKENVISKRLGELRSLGLVRETGETRPGSSYRHQLVFAATEAGRQATA